MAVHKKHAKKGGCAASKAPAEALCAPLATLNIAYPKLRVAHLDPLILSVDDFLNGDECDELIALASHADDLTEEEIVQVWVWVWVWVTGRNYRPGQRQAHQL